MSGYLDSYGAGQERREKIVRRLLLGALAAAILAATLYFFFRNWREDRQLRAFLELVRKQDYPAAYQLWGCTQAAPCRDYRFEKFLEDWGPKNPRGAIAAARIAKTRSCDTGVIYTLEYGKNEDPLLLWVERKDRVLGYAPWPSCNPRMQAPGP
ncbi:MAG: hypothetical protein HY822_22275 [Acidobacteria bacterium]|nr:hypothetical protein [Acidobacteriota bacterium]